MNNKFIPVSMTYKETEADDGIGSELPIVDKRIGSFTERLKSIIGEGSGRAFALQAGINEGSVRNMLRGGLPRLDTLVAIADTSKVNLTWLATGDGPMKTEQTPSDVLENIEQILSEIADDAQVEQQHDDAPIVHLPLDSADRIAKAVRDPCVVSRTLQPTPYILEEYATAPFYDVDASCGHGAWNDNAQIISQLAFRRDWLKSEGLEASKLAAIRARGDSMAPTIQSGDTLLVDLRVNTPRNDGIYIIEQDGGISAKRIQRAPDGTLYIRSDNPAYLDFTIPAGHAINIIGRLAWFGRRVS